MAMSFSMCKNFQTVALSCVILLAINLALHAQSPLPDDVLAFFGEEPFHNGSHIHHSQLSPDGKLLATMSQRSASVWDTATGKRLHRFFFDIAWLQLEIGLAFSPDSKKLACRFTSDCIVVWNLVNGKALKRLAVDPFDNSSATFCRFSADGTAIILQGKEQVVWVNVETGATVHRLPGVRITELSPDEKIFVEVDERKSQMRIGDAKTGKVKHNLSIAAGKYGSALWLPDGVTLVLMHNQKGPDGEGQPQGSSVLGLRSSANGAK